MQPLAEQKPDNLLISEMQLLLAENRTDMALLRTGIALFGLPLSVLGLLVATSHYWDFSDAHVLFIVLVVVCAFLAIMAIYLILIAIRRIRGHHRIMQKIKLQDKALAQLMDF